MTTKSKSLVARAALGLAALAGLVAAVPASARPFEGYRGWGHERVWVARGYGPVYYGYGPAWRPAPVYAPGPVIVWHGHYGHYGRW